MIAKEVQEQTTQLVTARSKFFEISKRYGPKHPARIAAQAELWAAEHVLIKGKSDIQTINKKTVTLRELQRQVDSNRKLYDTFLNRLKEASQAVDLQAIQARVADPAVIPVIPFKPKKVMLVALAFFASLMLGVLLAFLIEALDKTFKGPNDIERKLGLPMLGLLPMIRGKKNNTRESLKCVMLDSTHTTYAEAMRTIRTGLLLSNLDNPHKVILVTSSLPGEGKTIVTTNLSIAMAKMEKVLLIGADLRRPSLAKMFALDDGRPGLANLTAGTAKLDECVYRFEDGNIDILSCGQIPPNPLELLSSKHFATLISQLEKQYDRIVIDSPPIQAVSDALVLSQYAKAVVYVIEADSTHDDAVKNGIKRLQDNNAPIVGVILNKFDVEKASKYGYEYSGYYDHYGYSVSTQT